MSFHRPPGAIAVSYNTNTMAPLSPSRRYNSGNSGTTTSTIGSTTNSTKFPPYRPSGPIDRINHSTSSYRSSSRKINYSPVRSVLPYNDVGSVGSSSFNLSSKYSSTSTSSASSTTSSSTSSNVHERNGICPLTVAEFYAKYSPTTYTPNIHGSSSSLSNSSSSSTLNGHCRSSFSSPSSIIGLAELHGGDERDTAAYDRWSTNRQIKRSNNPINTVLTGHDEIDSVVASSEVKQQHEENIVRNNINIVIDNDNNGNNNDCDLKNVNVPRISNHDDNNDKDNDNQFHHDNHNLTLADETRKFTTTSSSNPFLSTCVIITPLLSSISPNHPTSQSINSPISPTIASTSVTTTTITTITATTATNTIITPTATATPTHSSATSSVVSIDASTTDCRAYSWIKAPTNANNTKLLTNNNDQISDEFCIAKQNINNKKSPSILDSTQWMIGNVDNVDQQIHGRNINAEANNEFSMTNDFISKNNESFRHDVHLIDCPIKILDNVMKSENNDLLDENVRLTTKPNDNHGNESSKPSTSKRTTFFGWDDSVNASTSSNTSIVPVGVHQAIYRENNDQIEESSTSRPPRNRIQSRRDEGYGLNGLRNIGNTCFMNSVIQCLSNTRPLLEYLLNEQYLNDINTTTSSMKGALMKAFAQVIHELWESSGERVVNTTSLKTQIQRFAPRFMGYAQQDAQEFLRYLLEGLHEDVNRVTIKPQPILTDIPDHYSDSHKAAESWKRYLRSEDSTIVDVFVGQLRSSLTCTSCDHVSVTLDPFWDLSLPIPVRSGTVKLNQCLEHFTKVETLDGDEKPICSKCQMRTKCTKSFSIQKFPKILVIHLKRFSPTERFRAKLSVLVDFPLMGLDLSAFTAPGVRGCTYNLYGVANHSGTPYSGHYTAYCKHPYSSEWHEYNDSRVSSVSTNSVISSEAYVLFYEQQPLSHHL
ncbi:hypothetical protein PV327_004381 [Microctonus hyperodae]|uniref:Ubiquitin carboxyl-terminal hydrolase n=1 Tax=Microctonus hyperodae TaxID=165561 RepID=A0AA39KMI5_MICHY|nr:hypothetical protein PV327_004381 [Microctonus hyperodae]